MFTLQTFWLDTKTSEDDEVVCGHLAARQTCKTGNPHPPNNVTL
jgi:hypothetical protein